MTEIKDVDLLILSKLDDRDLLNFCMTSKYGKYLCKNEDFWRNRFMKKYSDKVKYRDISKTWKHFYLGLISLTDIISRHSYVPFKYILSFQIYFIL